MAGKKQTYVEVKAEIEALEAKAAELRAEEIENVLADVRQKVADYGLTEQQVFGRKRGTRKTGDAPSFAEAKTPGAPRYRHPKTGATWTGKGRAPGWISSAKNRDRFLIVQ